MNNYAPEYTKRERVILLIKHLAWALPLFAMTNYWLLPWFEAYAKQAHCYNYGQFTGIHIVFYSVFVGLPLSFALVLFALEGPRNIKIIQLAQHPLPNEKVLRRTQYSYGLKAKIRAYLFFVILAFLGGLSIKGIDWANAIIDTSKNKEFPPCLTN